jgi:hypothetical protein
MYINETSISADEKSEMKTSCNDQVVPGRAFYPKYVEVLVACVARSSEADAEAEASRIRR